MPDEWERFLHHAARVKTLEWAADSSTVHNDIFDALSLYRPSGNAPLMPRLRKLTWVPNCHNIRLIQLFLHPGLVDLSLSVPMTRIAAQRVTAKELAGILTYVEYTCSSLRTLSLRGLDKVPGPDLDVVASSFVPSLKKLRKYNGDAIFFPNAIRSLALSSMLLEAKFVTFMDPLVITLLRAAEDPLFSSLRSMDATFIGGVDQIATFLNLTHSSSCTRTEIGITCDDPPSDLLQEWMKEIRKAAKHNPLTKLSFTFPLSQKKVRPLANASDHRLDLTLSIFDPLLAVKQLTQLHIRSSYLQLDDTSLKRFANALPNLKSLKLLPRRSTMRSAIITIDGFISLIHACPHLESLGLPFDARITPHRLPRSLHRTSYRNDRFHTLEVADSPIALAQSSFVALIMSGLFGNPEIDIIIGSCEVGVSGDWVSPRMKEEYDKGWTEVRKQTKYLVMARLSERSGKIINANGSIPNLLCLNHI